MVTDHCHKFLLRRKKLPAGTTIEEEKKTENEGHHEGLEKNEGEEHGRAYAVGIFNFSPTTMRSLSKLLVDLRALTVVPHVLAMWLRVSPDLTK